MKVLVLTPVDSSGASGLTAAVEAIRSIGADPYPVPTAITGQRVRNDKIELKHELSVEEIKRLIALNAPYDSAFLAVEPIPAKELGIEKTVVDPVLYTSYGAKLFDVDEALRIIEGAYVITPNLREARELSGEEDPIEAAKALARYSKRVIVKNVERRDLVLTPHGRTVRLEPKEPAVGYRDLRGTGTFYAATIAGLLALGYNVIEAAREAKRLVEISSALSVYTGSEKIDPQVYLRRRAIESEAERKLKEAIKKVLELERLPMFLPEVGSNFAYALPWASDVHEVFGISGRIVRLRRGSKYAAAMAGEVLPGGSRHIARAILTMMRHYPELRSCMNIRYHPKLVEFLEQRFRVSFYDRTGEPEEIKKQEGKTTPRGIEQAVRRGIEKYGKKPLDVVYHKGDRGKEPMILIFGRDPEEVYEKVAFIVNRFDRSRVPSRACTLRSAF